MIHRPSPNLSATFVADIIHINCSKFYKNNILLHLEFPKSASQLAEPTPHAFPVVSFLKAKFSIFPKFLLMLALTLLVFAGQVSAQQLVTIPDANLRAAIETALDKERGAPITPAEMASLTRLEALNSNINDLTGLEFASGLTRLHLFNNNISDLSALSGLTNLIWISLGQNGFSDVSALSNLTNMTRLGFDYNSVSDVSALSGMTGLTELFLRGNSISDLSPLVANTGLGSGDRIDVRDNPLSATSLNTHISALQNRGATILSDASKSVAIPDANLRAAIENRLIKERGAPITRAEMASLTRLEAPNSNISDLTGLEFASGLTWLSLGSNSISDVSALSGLTNLTLLVLRNNSISDVSALSGLTNLRVLSLRGNGISDLSPLVANMGLDSTDVVDVRDNPLSGKSHATHIRALEDRWVTVKFDTLKSVTIPDANLRAAIETALDKERGAPITPAEMASLTRLEALNSNINDLTGLEFASGLTRLHLFNNNISDLSALSGLTNLIWISLGQNGFSDVSALSNLTNMTRLGFDYNSVSDVSALSGMTGLTELFLRGNSISDLSPLVANTGLGSGDRIDVRDNPLSIASHATHIPALKGRGVNVQFTAPRPVAIPDANLRAAIENRLGKARGAPITPVEMASLTRLEAPNSNISDLTGLEFASGLTRLGLGIKNVSGKGWVNSNEISDLSPLSGLTNLTYLNLRYNNISDIAPLSDLTSLRVLNLDRNNISDITPLSSLTSLTWLSLPGNSISDPSSLSGLTSLIHLNLSSNNVSDPSSLSGLTSLTFMGLGGNNISDIAPLSGLTSLTQLDLYRNKISDITSLSDLTSLRSLSLDTNNISDIAPLSGLTSLTQLDLDRNKISDITSLSGLTSLTGLNLYNNSISDLSPLVASTGLGRGDRVEVRRNPLSTTSRNTHIPALQARGVNVQF